MSFEEYWDGDPFLIRVYRKAHQLREERENLHLWMQGMYIYEALCAVSPVLHAFAKSGTAPLPYREAPYPLSKEEAERQAEEQMERKKKVMIEKFKLQMEAVNQNFKEEGKHGDVNRQS